MVEFRILQESSLVDWDGMICAVAWVPRCNLGCSFCQNGKLLLKPDEFPVIAEERILALFAEHGDYLDGLCITGGEPTTYADLPDFLERIKPTCKKIKLDTNGTNPAMLRQIISGKLVDYIAMDIKAPLDERYEKAVGCKIDVENVKESVKLLMQSAPGYEFRTTVVPTLVSKKEIPEMGMAIEGARKWALQQYVPRDAWQPEMRLVKPYQRETVMEMAEIAKGFAKEVVVRGV